MRHYYWAGIKNFGDLLNIPLIEWLTGARPHRVECDFRNRTCDDVGQKFFVIGSVLAFADHRTTVWGSGLISSRPESMPLEPPLEVCAVRGPLTRNLLISRFGIDCPSVFGDPALLLPRFFNPKVQKTHAFGIVTHHRRDIQHPWVQQYVSRPDVKLINTQCGESDLLNTIQAIRQCEQIVSSSLHGIIVADAYRVPSAWIELYHSDGICNVFGSGFKFRDYYASIGNLEAKPTIIDHHSTFALPKIATNDVRDIQCDLELLIAACPFLCKRNALACRSCD